MLVRDIRLCLLGTPTFFVDKTQIKFEPRIAFECFAHILVAGEQGISRVQLANFMWSHLKEEKSRTTQLRQALTDIRRQLREHNLTDLVELDGSILRVAQNVQIDFTELKVQSQLSMDQIELLLQPLAKGWVSSHPKREDLWQVYRDQAADILAQAFEHRYRNNNRKNQLAKLSSDAWLTLLRRAVSLYPTNQRIHSILVWELKQLDCGAQVEEIFLKFSDEWMDRFGGEKSPSIEKWAPPLQVTNPDADRKGLWHLFTQRPFKVVTQLVLGFSVIALVSLYALANSSVEPVELTDYFQREISTPSGKFRFFNLATNQSLQSLRTFSDGSVMCLSEHPFMFEIDSNLELKRVGSYKPEIVDKLMGSKVLYREKSGATATFMSGGKKYLIEPTEALPILCCFSIRRDGSLLFLRSSNDIDRSRHRLCLLKDGKETLLDNNFESVRISVPTFLTDRIIYAKYSRGTPDKWRYTSFTYDTLTNKTEVLNVPPVVGKMSDETLVCMPEVTTENEGNYYTRWDGTVKLYPVNQPPVQLNYKGQTRFYGCWSIGDVILLAIYDNPFNPGYVALDRNGKIVPEISTILREAKNIIPTSRGAALFLRQQNRYMLLESAQ
jgi:hypothetical protein